MEQAEQFFSAAQAVGPPTKPVLLFYGLSQAARSIAAASVTAQQSEWRLGGGHGITVGAMQGVSSSGLASLTLRDTGKGSFTALAALLGVASLPTETRIGDLWSLIPHLDLAPLKGVGRGSPLAVTREDNMIMRNQRTRIRVAPIPGDLVDTGLPEGPATGDLAGVIQAQREAVTAYLNEYPTLLGWSFAMPDGNPIGAMRVSVNAFDVPLILSSSSSAQEEVDDIAERTFNYQGVTYAFPRTSGSSLAAHPLLLWYAVLFGLSMLSRYEPKAWAKLIAIDSSEDASPIEAALDEAMRTLPQVILQTIYDVAS